jgi:hypothetical protein
LDTSRGAQFPARDGSQNLSTLRELMGSCFNEQKDRSRQCFEEEGAGPAEANAREEGRMEFKGQEARLQSILSICWALTDTWNGRSVNWLGLLLGPACRT